MIGMVAIAGGAAFLFSALALRMGLEHMGVRYGLASVAGYFAFVGMVRAWIAWQRGRLGDALDAVDVVDVVDAANAFGPELIPAPRSGPALFGGGRSGGAGASSAWGEGGSVVTLESGGASKPGGWSFDFDDAWPIVVAVIGVVLGALAIVYTIWIAPVLLAEVALDAALVTALYSRMTKADAGTWLGATLRRTWVAGAALTVFMAITGTALTYVAPEARSIGGVLRSVRLGAAGVVLSTTARPLARSGPPSARDARPDARATLGPNWRDAGLDPRARLGPGSRTAQQPVYDAWAIRFAHVPYALSSLVAGAERGPRVDIAFTVWPLRDQRSQRIVLVDAGFYREKFLAQWKPVEYVRPDRALAAVLQREVGSDTQTFALALRAALRQAPKVILVGEMRDVETIQIALEASETGHLVLSTLHTIDAAKTIERIVGVFPRNEERQVRTRFAQAFKWVVSQRLVPKAGGGRIAVCEVLRSTSRTREYVQEGEREGKSILDAMEDGSLEGMQTFDRELERLIAAGVLDREVALSYSTNRTNLQLRLETQGSDVSEAPTVPLKMPAAPRRPAPRSEFDDLIER
jgi:hypothetical protein